MKTCLCLAGVVAHPRDSWLSLRFAPSQRRKSGVFNMFRHLRSRPLGLVCEEDDNNRISSQVIRVANMPGAEARISAFALSNGTIGRALSLTS